jgi:hypothetical protein
MSGKPQMLCCAAPPSRAGQDRLGPMLTRPLLIRADFDRVPTSGWRFLHGRSSLLAPW